MSIVCLLTPCPSVCLSACSLPVCLITSVQVVSYSPLLLCSYTSLPTMWLVVGTTWTLCTGSSSLSQTTLPTLVLPGTSSQRCSLTSLCSSYPFTRYKACYHVYKVCYQLPGINQVKCLQYLACLSTRYNKVHSRYVYKNDFKLKGYRYR